MDVSKKWKLEVAAEAVQLTAAELQLLTQQFEILEPGSLTSKSWDFSLSSLEGKLIVKDKSGRKLSLDFEENKSDYHRKFRGKAEPFYRALNLGRGGESPRILDLTAGLAIDAVAMAKAGAKVTALERNSLLYLLLSRAQLQSTDSSVAAINFVFSEAKDFIQTSNLRTSFDVVYLDPMYPHKKKSALPRQEMLLFRELVGEDLDAAELATLIIDHGASRLVVKRPDGAEFLLPNPLHSIEGKTVRYDVYQSSNRTNKEK